LGGEGDGGWRGDIDDIDAMDDISDIVGRDDTGEEDKEVGE